MRSPSLLLLALPQALLACAHAPTTLEGPEITGVELRLRPSGGGEGEVPDGGEVTRALSNHAPLGLIFVERARLDELALEIDRRRIESYFREHGYFGVSVGEPLIEPDPEGGPDQIILAFEVAPGPASRVRRLELQGAGTGGAETDEPTLRGLLELREGEPFHYPAYNRGKERLRSHLVAAGYAHAIVTGRVEVAERSAEVAVLYRIDPGPMVRFGDLRIEGRTELPPRSILSRAAFSRGDRFDPELLARTEAREYELSSIGTVRFELDRTGRTESADVTIHVSDALPNELRLGVGVGVTPTRYELAGRAAFLRRRFLHPLYSLRGELRPSVSYVEARDEPEPNITATAEIERDDLLIPRLTMTIGASFEVTQYELYRTLGPSFFFGLDRPLLDDLVRASVRFELASQDLATGVAAAEQAAIGFYGAHHLVAVTPALVWDRRDDLLGPRRGTYLRLELEVGRLLSEGGGTWVKVTPDARAYLSLGTPRLVLAARVRAGAAFAGDIPVPVTRRYFAGGSESQRGFSRRFLSPDIVDALGNRGPTGGEALLEGALELRFDVVELFGSWLGLVAFADAGDVTARLEDLDVTNLHLAVGPGLRYRTPIGPLRFDFGFRLNRTGSTEPEPEGTWSFHFSLGEAF